jgi:hypothetical protein
LVREVSNADAPMHLGGAVRVNQELGSALTSHGARGGREGRDALAWVRRRERVNDARASGEKPGVEELFQSLDLRVASCHAWHDPEIREPVVTR